MNSTKRFVTSTRMSGICLQTAACAAALLAVAWVHPAAAATNYVWDAGSHTPPYDTWTTASTNLRDAVNYACSNYPAYDTVMVTNGVYNTAAEVIITNGIALRSVSVNPNDTTIRRDGTATHRVLRIAHTNALVDGFTLTNGRTTDRDNNNDLNAGAGVYLTGGTLRNCVVAGNARACSVGSVGNIRGGGVFMTGGVMTNCTVRNNLLTGLEWSLSFGGGVYATGGTIVGCTIKNNEARGTTGYNAASGGGLYMSGGTLVHNCLIVGNTLKRGTSGNKDYELGAGVCIYGGTLSASTIASNVSFYGTTVAMGAFGGIYQNGGTVRNCIAYSNTSASASSNFGFLGGVREFSCAPELIPGAGTSNIVSNPRFVDFASGDYRLMADSPCVDAGKTLAAEDTDLDGVARPVDGAGDAIARFDMGCYEFVPGATFTCNILASTNVGLQTLDDVVFTATVAGPAATTNIAYYGWDFGNGTAEGASVTHDFGPGKYTVTLTVKNTLGQITNAVKTDLIRVVSQQAHVSTNGAASYPFDTWEKATSDPTAALWAMLDATRLAGAESADVLFSNGVFDVTDELVLNAPIRLYGLNGATNTVLRRSGSKRYRVLRLTHANAMAEGLTVTNGYSDLDGSANGGGGVYISAGTLKNCIVVNNVRNPYTSMGDNAGSYGGGVYMIGGVMTNCVVRGNTADSHQIQWYRSYGGGVYAEGSATLFNCRIESNTSYGGGDSYTEAYGGGVYIKGAALRNCLLLSNLVVSAGTTSSASQSSAYGGGLYMAGAGGSARNCLISGNTAKRSTKANQDERGSGVWMDWGNWLINCTVAGNTGFYGSNSTGGYSGGGVFRVNGTLRNCVIWSNQVAGAANDYYGDVAAASYSCAPELTPDTVQSNLNSNPLFIDSVAGDYRLQASSPCINKGLDDLAWMTTATDLAGQHRIIGKAVDIGAYEWAPPQGTVITIQ